MSRHCSLILEKKEMPSTNNIKYAISQKGFLKMEDIIINESFSDEDDSYFEELTKKNIDSEEIFDLRVKAEELAGESEINEIISYYKIKKNLEYELPHQKEGALKILRDMNGSGLLADEVGLGKTITAGIIIRESVERGFAKKIMILTPPSLVNQWLAELKNKFELDFKVVESENDWKNNFVIASIDRVKNYDRENGRFRHYKAHEESWDILIVDEAHKLKDKSSVRWKFVDSIQKKRFLILTATPFQNDLFELYNLLHLLKRGHLGTIKEFRDKFLHKGNKRKPLNHQELRRKLNEVMVRRIRSETNVEYRKRIPKIVSVELSKEEFEVYQEVCDLLRKQYYSYSGREINGKLIVFAILPKITSSVMAAKESLKRIVDDQKYHEKTRKSAFEILEKYNKIEKDSKADKLVEIVKEIFEKDRNSKALIYTKHPVTLKYLSGRLKKLDLKIVEFLGGLDREQRDKIINEFRNEADILMSTETGSEGLNFQFCNNLINYDLPWNPMSVEQRIGRIDRIGQKKDMNIYSLATKNTMEEHVVDLIINKMCCIGLVIGELPIILFNLGLDERNREGVHKIEEMLMESFLDSKNNLDNFAKDVKDISKMIEKGIEDYKKSKEATAKVLDKDDK